MKRRVRTTAATLVLTTGVALMTIALPAMAQNADPLPLRFEDVDTRDHPQVTITVGVPSELVGTEIASEAFTVTENGTVVDAAVEAVPSDDLEVVLVLDVSGSMTGGPLSAAQSAALSFIDEMPPGVRVAVVTFADTTAVASSFTSDADNTTAAVLGLNAAGETALYDGLLIAAEQFNPTARARRIVILLSDGGDTVSQTTLETALVAMLGQEVSFYAIELQTPENDSEALARLATATKGTVVPATDPAALQGIFAEIADQLTNQYLLSYVSETFGTVEVTVAVEVEGSIASGSQTLRLPPAPAPAVETETDPVASSGAVTEPDLAVVRPGSLVQLTLWQESMAFYLGTVLILAGLGGAFFAARGARARGRSVLAEEHSDRLTETSTPGLRVLADRAIEFADRSLQGERGGRLNKQLDQAGVSMRPAEFAVLTAIGAIVGLALGYIVFGIPGGVVGAIVALILIRFVIGRKADKRKAAFAEQLPDALHLMGGSLRSGFGLLQAIDVIAAESPSPTAEEFQRVKVEVHLGRDMDEALHAMAERVGSEDFQWVSEGIQIHREVGGDIAEIIDSVTATIRSRNQIRRRIRSLSAEGRISAIILVALPIVLFVMISLVNPAYIGELTTSSLGRTLIMGGLVGLVVGTVWIKRIIRLEF